MDKDPEREKDDMIRKKVRDRERERERDREREIGRDRERQREAERLRKRERERRGVGRERERDRVRVRETEGKRERESETSQCETGTGTVSHEDASSAAVECTLELGGARALTNIVGTFVTLLLYIFYSSICAYGKYWVICMLHVVPCCSGLIQLLNLLLQCLHGSQGNGVQQRSSISEVQVPRGFMSIICKAFGPSLGDRLSLP